MISEFIFKKLITNSYSEDSSIECVSIKSKFAGFEISFYAWKDNGYKLVVEDFGYSKNGEWVQLQPTINQLTVMNDSLVSELHRLQHLESEKYKEGVIQMQFEEDCFKYKEIGF